MHRLLMHLRSNAVAYLALSIALGGTSYAAASLPRNSVGSRQLRSNAVTSQKVKNGSLTASDFSAAAITALRGTAGPAGPAGAQGPQGVAGSQGSAGVQGAPGAKGDAARTFTGWSRASTGGPITTDTLVTDLAGTGGASSSGALTLPVRSRVFLSGTVDLFNQSATEPVRVNCLARNSNSGEQAILFDVTFLNYVDIHQGDPDSSALSGYVFEPLSVTGTVVLDPGTYNIGIACTKVAGSGLPVFGGAAMNAIAVPEP